MPEMNVTPVDRVMALTDLLGIVLTENDSFEYKWEGGYESLTLSSTDTHGSLQYRGMYHAKDGLCEGNPCKWCGHVWHDDVLDKEEVEMDEEQVEIEEYETEDDGKCCEGQHG